VAANYGREVITFSESRSYLNMNVCRFKFRQRIWRENYYCDTFFTQPCLCKLRTLRIFVNKICSPTDSEKRYTYLLHHMNWKIKGTNKPLNHNYVYKQTNTAFCKIVGINWLWNRQLVLVETNRKFLMITYKIKFFPYIHKITRIFIVLEVIFNRSRLYWSINEIKLVMKVLNVRSSVKNKWSILRACSVTWT